MGGIEGERRRASSYAATKPQTTCWTLPCSRPGRLTIRSPWATHIKGRKKILGVHRSFKDPAWPRCGICALSHAHARLLWLRIWRTRERGRPDRRPRGRRFWSTNDGFSISHRTDHHGAGTPALWSCDAGPEGKERLHEAGQPSSGSRLPKCIRSISHVTSAWRALGLWLMMPARNGQAADVQGTKPSKKFSMTIRRGKRAEIFKYGAETCLLPADAGDIVRPAKTGSAAIGDCAIGLCRTMVSGKHRLFRMQQAGYQANWRAGGFSVSAPPRNDRIRSEADHRRRLRTCL